ncbi:DsbA family protein [Salinarchaeum chitinilyticum]
MSTDPEKITVYADYVCPFCYLGRESLEAYRSQREEALAIEWHPFDLRAQKRGPDGEIDHSVDDGKDEEYFEQARQNVERLQERYGADEMLGMDEVEDVDSLDAQVASHYVQTEHPDAWEAFDEAIYEAHWEEGRDIGDVEVLAELAESVGIDGDEVRTAVEDEDRRERVGEAFDDARQVGITGVPTFVYDDYAARGAVPPEQLERLVEGN